VKEKFRITGRLCRNVEELKPSPRATLGLRIDLRGPYAILALLYVRPGVRDINQTPS
jgi:hypothetical protein